MIDDELKAHVDAQITVAVALALADLSTTIDVAVAHAIGDCDRRAVEYVNAREESMRQLLDQRLAGASQYVTNLAAADVANAERRIGGKLDALRDSLIAANGQIVIDMNETLRGIHARLSVLEQVAGIAKSGLGPRYVPFDVMTVVGNLSAALADATRKLTGEND